MKERIDFKAVFIFVLFIWVGCLTAGFVYTMVHYDFNKIIVKTESSRAR